MARSSRAPLMLALLLRALMATEQSGCGSSNGNSAFNPGGSDAGDDGTVGDGGSSCGDTGTIGFGDVSTNHSGFQVTPSTLQTVTVQVGNTTPTVTFSATYNGSPVAVAWGVDRGNIGTVPAGPSMKGVLAPSGSTGGVVDVIATYGGKSLQVPVLVK